MNRLDPRFVWLQLFRTFLVIIIFSFATVPILWIGDEAGNTYLTGNAIKWFIVFAIALIIIGFIVAYLTYVNYKYELTDTSFKKESGIINKHYAAIPYERIQNVDIYRSLTSRLFGLSSLHIQTAGASGSLLSEGILPGLSKEVAMQVREDLISRAKNSRRNTA